MTTCSCGGSGTIYHNTTHPTNPMLDSHFTTPCHCVMDRLKAHVDSLEAEPQGAAPVEEALQARIDHLERQVRSLNNVRLALLDDIDQFKFEEARSASLIEEQRKEIERLRKMAYLTIKVPGWLRRKH